MFGILALSLLNHALFSLHPAKFCVWLDVTTAAKNTGVCGVTVELHKRWPNSAWLRRYKSWNISLESGELIQICTLWEQKLAHRTKECNSAGSLVPIFHLDCTPAIMFCNFASFLVLTGKLWILWEHERLLHFNHIHFPDTSTQDQPLGQRLERLVCTWAQHFVLLLVNMHSTDRQKAQQLAKCTRAASCF